VTSAHARGVWAAPSSDGGRVVLVCGASGGIGRATAVACARRGDRLVLAARAEESLLAAERECRALGADTLVVPTDVTDPAAVDALLAAAVERFGRVDAVVHSAVVVAYGRFDELPAAVFDRVVATTLTGTTNVARGALRSFRDQGAGRLVLVGSLLGKIAVPYMSAYVTAKWAVHGLARTLQVEARQTPGIDVSLLSPGSVNTPVYRQAATYLGRSGRPPPPVDPPEKVARAVLRALDRPRRDSSVGLANPMIVLGFRALPAVYDALVLPLMRLAGLTRGPVRTGDGNVFVAHATGDATHGSWGRHWLRPAGAAAAAAVGAAATAAWARGSSVRQTVKQRNAREETLPRARRRGPGATGR
jgi:NAD(P)-dependent dehydrogenase (short-subunit alcohol dehydrogenase family)